MDLLNIGDLRAARYMKQQKQRQELELMLNCCEITYKSVLHINSIDRVELTNYLDRLRVKLKRELEKLNERRIRTQRI